MKVWIVESWGKWMEDEDAIAIEKVFDSLEKAKEYVKAEKLKEARTEIGHKKKFTYTAFEVE